MMPQKNLLLFTGRPLFLCSIDRELSSGAAQEQMHLRILLSARTMTMLGMSQSNPQASLYVRREGGFSLKGKEEPRMKDRARSWTGEEIFSVLSC